MTEHGRKNKKWLEANDFVWEEAARMYWSKTFQVMVSHEMAEYTFHEPFVNHINKTLKNAKKRA